HHLNDQWRGQMWGKEGGAFVKNDKIFSTFEEPPRVLQLVFLYDGLREQRRLTDYEIADLGIGHLKGISWIGHEGAFYQAGCRHPEEPFTIPGHGMGMFAVRKDGWLPFHEEARGFGGEEM